MTIESPPPGQRLFADRPVPRRLYRAIRTRIERIGPVVVRSTESQVSFRARRMFASVWLPQLWTHSRPEDSVTLSFVLDHQVNDPRIVESVEPRPGRWTHHVVIENETDLDVPVEGWLREAYALADRTDRRRS
jgi:hypothetical protein